MTEGLESTEVVSPVARLQGAAQLIDALDRPQPQVEIEAKIMQTNRDTAKALGCHRAAVRRDRRRGALIPSVRR